MSATDFHVLLVLASEDLYGYAIMKAVEAQSRGAVSPEIGSLYRVLARLMKAGLVVELDSPDPDAEPRRGQPRRYYRITPAGRSALRAEAERLRHAVSLASGLFADR
jgi:DNA-binding PadR family transcriptional regulator